MPGGSEAVTIRDVAARAGVSTGTVSRVLNEHADVAEGLRRRVVEAAEELGYRRSRTQRERDRAGRRPSSRAGLRVGFVLTLPYLPGRRDLMAPFWAEILQGAEAEARRHGASVTYASLHTARDEASTRGEIAAMHLDGVLLAGAPSRQLVTLVESLGLPVVLVDEDLHGDGDAVVPDYLDGARRVVRHLLAAGHRRIACVTGPGLPQSPLRSSVPAIESRVLGYLGELGYAGVGVDTGLIESSDLTPEGGYDAACRLLDRRAAFTAIFCVNDPVAFGVLRALHERRIDVPGGVSVAGGDDEYAGRTFPPLTTMRIDKQAVGAAAVRQLFLRQAEPSSPCVTITVPVHLVVRASVASPKA